MEGSKMTMIWWVEKQKGKEWPVGVPNPSTLCPIFLVYFIIDLITAYGYLAKNLGSTSSVVPCHTPLVFLHLAIVTPIHHFMTQWQVTNIVTFEFISTFISIWVCVCVNIELHLITVCGRKPCFNQLSPSLFFFFFGWSRFKPLFCLPIIILYAMVYLWQT